MVGQKVTLCQLWEQFEALEKKKKKKLQTRTSPSASLTLTKYN